MVLLETLYISIEIVLRTRSPHRNFVRGLPQSRGAPRGFFRASEQVSANSGLISNPSARFLDLLAKYEGQGRKLSHKTAAKDYAPRVFTTEKGSIGLKRFEQAMECLFERKEIFLWLPLGCAQIA